jgi:hypothetical protein
MAAAGTGPYSVAVDTDDDEDHSRASTTPPPAREWTCMSLVVPPARAYGSEGDGQQEGSRQINTTGHSTPLTITSVQLNGTGRPVPVHRISVREEEVVQRDANHLRIRSLPASSLIHARLRMKVPADVRADPGVASRPQRSTTVLCRESSRWFRRRRRCSAIPGRRTDKQTDDDNSDDNRDDNCSLNNHRYTVESSPSCLVTTSARSC